MNSAEINPHEWGLGKPCAGKPPARFDEGESSAAGYRLAALSTLLGSSVRSGSLKCLPEAVVSAASRREVVKSQSDPFRPDA